MFIELTKDRTKEKILVNANRINAVHKSGDHTYIDINLQSQGSLFVKETVEEIKEMLKSAKS